MWKLINTADLLAILIAMAMVFTIPSAGLAQNHPAGTPGPPQPQGGIATVVGVDQPDNCLRIRSGPGEEYDVIGCANMGDQLRITGVWTSNDWAQLEDNGWVYGPQIATDLRPPQTAYSAPPTYVVREAIVPDYDDWGYLPPYGYTTYSYGGVPIFLYNVAVWRWCHPCWWWRGLQAWWWRDGFHGRRLWDGHSFRNFAMTRGVNVHGAERANVSALNRMGRTTRSASIPASEVRRSNVNRSNITSPNAGRFNTNRPNVTSPNVGRFNTNRSNVNRSNITAPNVNRFNTNRSNVNRSNITAPNTNRFRTTPNASSSRTFSNTPSSRSSSASAFRSQSSSMSRSFRSGSSGGGSFRSMGGRGSQAMGGRGRQR